MPGLKHYHYDLEAFIHQFAGSPKLQTMKSQVKLHKQVAVFLFWLQLFFEFQIQNVVKKSCKLSIISQN